MSQVVHVRAPCRLHFGMFGFGRADRPQFGGIGVMIDSPAVEMTIVPAAKFHTTGTLPERARVFAEAAARAWQLPGIPPCEIRVCSPPAHVGLGVGTQVGLAIAAGLRRFLGLPNRPVEFLAQGVGRGARSAVGTYGFQQGGLIVDAGHEPAEPLGKLARRLAVPTDWRFVLICPAGGRGLAGAAESSAFLRLPPVPNEDTRRLWQIAEHEVVPAIERNDCPAFGDAVYRFGRLAGECFAAVQGGPFASREIARLVEAIRGFGVAGVGQSSWGPTVFAVCPSDADAQRLASRAVTELHVPMGEIHVAHPNNCGAAFN